MSQKFQDTPTTNADAENEKEKHKGLLRKSITLFLTLLVCIILWCIPTANFDIPGLTIIQQRVIVIFLFAILMWLFNTIPAWATSVAIMTLLILTASDNSLWLFAGPTNSQAFGTVLSAKSIVATIADPINILFLGGFVLALAATKSGLDVLLARTLLKPFGTKSENVLLGFILITGIFSMFISNTATAAMMLAFLTPVFKNLPSDGKGRVALTMAIPIGANIGGMGTPIGTPPNAIALKFLNDPNGLNLNIGFGEWMSFMLPFAIILLLISWFIIRKLFPFKQKNIVLKIEGNTKKNYQTYIIYGTFAVTVLMWILDKYTGVSAGYVAMIPIFVLSATGVLTWKDLNELNWSVIWMMAGGFALGLALDKSGLAQTAIAAIPFGEWSPIIMLITSGLICYALSNFISNTATAALMVPIVAIVGKGMGGSLSAIGGEATLLIGIAIAASSAMILPISTPPNAIAHSTGMINQKDMMHAGILVGIISMLIGYCILYFLGISHFIA